MITSLRNESLHELALACRSFNQAAEPSLKHKHEQQALVGNKFFRKEDKKGVSAERESTTLLFRR